MLVATKFKSTNLRHLQNIALVCLPLIASPLTAQEGSSPDTSAANMASSAGSSETAADGSSDIPAAPEAMSDTEFSSLRGHGEKAIQESTEQDGSSNGSGHGSPATDGVIRKSSHDAEAKGAKAAGSQQMPRAKDDKSSFVDEKRLKKFMDSLSTTSRETVQSAKDSRKALKVVLDIRLPIIDNECDISTSHELLRLGYAYYANFSGADLQLRSAAETLVRKKFSEYQGVTAKCSAALKGFGVAVLRVYFGNDWTPEDARRLHKAQQEGDDSVPASAAEEKGDVGSGIK